jgi:hypothetical protein
MHTDRGYRGRNCEFEMLNTLSLAVASSGAEKCTMNKLLLDILTSMEAQCLNLPSASPRTQDDSAP